MSDGPDYLLRPRHYPIPQIASATWVIPGADERSELRLTVESTSTAIATLSNRNGFRKVSVERSNGSGLLGFSATVEIYTQERFDFDQDFPVSKWFPLDGRFVLCKFDYTQRLDSLNAACVELRGIGGLTKAPQEIVDALRLLGIRELPESVDAPCKLIDVHSSLGMDQLP